MRHFLYLTPYFPPQSQVGALRPLKFARHLPAHGWAPVVVCDLWPGAKTAPGLLEAVPDAVQVHHTYSHRAAKALARWRSGAASSSPSSSAPAPNTTPRLDLSRWIPDALNNPELIPLGEHSVHMWHGARAALEALRAHPECEAIMVNADPYAALLVGAWVAERARLPLILDLRDPWSVCELRKPRRPAMIQRLIEAMERWAFARASRVIFNTETTFWDYTRRYPEWAAERFVAMRNHGDPELIAHGEPTTYDRFTLLFLGRFRRFVEGTALLQVLAELRKRGVAPDALQLVVTGDIPDATWEHARALGVDAMLKAGDFVPYRAIGPAMASADVLVMLSNRTRQRIPAKLFDYALSDRPILSMADSEELDGLLGGLGGACSVGLDDVGKAADFIEAELAKGRQRHVARPGGGGLDSASASATLARLLEDVADV